MAGGLLDAAHFDLGPCKVFLARCRSKVAKHEFARFPALSTFPRRPDAWSRWPRPCTTLRTLFWAGGMCCSRAGDPGSRDANRSASRFRPRPLASRCPRTMEATSFNAAHAILGLLKVLLARGELKVATCQFRRFPLLSTSPRFPTAKGRRREPRTIRSTSFGARPRRRWRARH